MVFYFLEEDLKILDEQIERLTRKIKEIGKEMGESCQEGAETYHDNFAYEDGERQQTMWIKRVNELLKIRNAARIVRVGESAGHVGIGRIAVLVDQDTGAEKTICVSSFMTFNGENTVSYEAPLARMIMGAEVGDVRSGMLGGKKKIFEIVEII